jgi:hypothetical protein
MGYSALMSEPRICAETGQHRFTARQRSQESYEIADTVSQRPTKVLHGRSAEEKHRRLGNDLLA